MNVPLSTSSAARLRRLGLVTQWLADDQVRLVRHASDAEWSYAGLTRATGFGFNPVRGEVHVAANALVTRWLDGDVADLRALNERDALMEELAYCVHDYLHAWAALQIAELAPELGFGTAPLGAANLDAHAFALLATEAVAVVGLDYWWLSTFDLPAELDIGSCFRNLAVSYRESDIDEFRRANPSFRAQEPGFLRSIAEFYCHGRFPGFDAADTRQSPRLLRWLHHELSYGQLQRRYTRIWLHHLAGLPLPGNAVAQAPVRCDEGWQTRLLDALGERLWAKVRLGDACRARRTRESDATWRAPEVGPIDARFTNLASFPDPDAAVAARGLVPDSRPQWAEQRLRLHPADDPEFLAVVPSLLRSVGDDDGALLRWSLRGRSRVDGGRCDETRDLFFLR